MRGDHRNDAVAGIRRRDFLELVSWLALASACRNKETPHPTPANEHRDDEHRHEPAHALDATAYRTLEAACARILPADGAFVGARDVNAIVFIDCQLGIAPLAAIAPLFMALARALDDAALVHGASELARLGVEQQDGILEKWSRGELGTKLPEQALFRAFHSLVLEGFLSDPQWGGNKDQLGWNAIGFLEPSLRRPGGRCHS